MKNVHQEPVIQLESKNDGNTEGGGAPGPEGAFTEWQQGAPNGIVERRIFWGMKMDFICAAVAFTVNSHLFKGFPLLCFRCGGVLIFLAISLPMIILGSIPLYYMELALGQQSGKGVTAAWSGISPVLKGIGYASILRSIYFIVTESLYLTWAFIYLTHSFANEPPWMRCDGVYNTMECYSLSGGGPAPMPPGNPAEPPPSWKYSNASMMNQSYGIRSIKFSAREFFVNEILDTNHAESVADVGGLKWKLVICLLAAYLICFLILMKGVKVYGKVMWFVALFPFLSLMILFIRGITLEGALQGIFFFITPNISALFSFETWALAMKFSMFSLCSGHGVLMTLSSYNRPQNNLYIDIAAIGALNIFVWVLAGLVTFTFAGFVSVQSGTTILDTLMFDQNPAFVTILEGLSSVPGARFWYILLFITMIFFGLGTVCGLLECVLKALSDELEFVRRHRWAALFLILVYLHWFGLGISTGGGYRVAWMLDSFSAPLSGLIVLLCEVLSVAYLFGAKRFTNNIRTMYGYLPVLSSVWEIFWLSITPIFLLILLIMRAITTYRVMGYAFSVGPWWVTMVEWLFTLSSIMCIPAYAVYVIIFKYRGFIQQAVRGSNISPEPVVLETFGPNITVNARNNQMNAGGVM